MVAQNNLLQQSHAASRNLLCSWNSNNIQKKNPLKNIKQLNKTTSEFEMAKTSRLNK